MKRIGFGQVEPNHLSAQRTSQIYAQLPANKDIAQLENGQFVKYDYANGEVNFEVVHTEGVYDEDTSWCKKGEKWEDNSVQVVGKGNINFVGKQTGF